MKRDRETREQSNKIWQLDSLVTLTYLLTPTQRWTHQGSNTPRTAGPTAWRVGATHRAVPMLGGRAPPGSEGRVHVHRSARCRRRRLRSVSDELTECIANDQVADGGRRGCRGRAPHGPAHEQQHERQHMPHHVNVCRRRPRPRGEGRGADVVKKYSDQKKGVAEASKFPSSGGACPFLLKTQAWKFSAPRSPAAEFVSGFCSFAAHITRRY